MTDSPILTSEDITFFRSTGQWNNKHRKALLDSHEALRAERDRWENAAADCAEDRRELRAALAAAETARGDAEAAADQAFARATAAEAERDQAIRERDYQYKLRSAMTDRALTAEAKIHTLREALTAERKYHGEDRFTPGVCAGCERTWPCASATNLDAALGEKNDGT